MQRVDGRLSLPNRNDCKINSTMKSPQPSKSAGVTPPIARQATPRPSVTQDVAVEKFSGLRLRYVFGILQWSHVANKSSSCPNKTLMLT